MNDELLTALSAEVARLRKENERLRDENENLRTAAEMNADTIRTMQNCMS